jgi:hypothetical protein
MTGVGALALVLCLGAGQAAAQDVIHGLDLLTSQPGTAADFSDNPIPGGFFGCSYGFNGSIPLGGDPIRGDQNLYSTDTMLRRRNDVAGGTGPTGLQIIGLCLKNKAWVGPCGNVWKVQVRLDPGRQQPITQLNMWRVSSSGGSFDAELRVLAEVLFTNVANGTVLGPITDDVVLVTQGSAWRYTPGPYDVVVNGPLRFDVLCDGSLAGYSAYGTSNFFPGGSSGIVYHQGPHPVKPAVKCNPGGTIPTPTPAPDPDPVDPDADADADASTTATTGGVVVTAIPTLPPCSDVIYVPATQAQPAQPR